MSRNQFAIADALPTSLFERPGIFEMDDDNILIGKVKAGILFYDPDTDHWHVEVAGVLYAEFRRRRRRSGHWQRAPSGSCLSFASERSPSSARRIPTSRNSWSSDHDPFQGVQHHA